MEYISREELLKSLTQECRDCEHDDPYWCEQCDFAIAMLYARHAPKADVQPVKHGYWEEVTDYGGWGDTHYRCSVCGEEWYLEDGKPKDNNMNFCPRCGAKMDAEPDEPWQSE